VANVNDRIRSDVKELLKQRGLTQQQLADMTGIERPNINAMLSGKVGKMPDRWEKLLDALGLEVVIRPKQTQE
jgi:predicted XRE-type DNA-binding protein